MATLKALVKVGASNLKQDGTRRVYIRLTHRNSVRFIPTEMYVTTRQLTPKLDFKDDWVRMHCEEIVLKYRQKLLALNLEMRDLPIDEIVRRITRKEDSAGTVSFTGYYEETWRPAHTYIKGLKNYDSALNALHKFFGRKEIFAAEVTARTMRRFAASLADRPRAASLYSSMVSRVFRDMRDDLNDEDTGDILVKHSLAKFTPPRQKVAVKRAIEPDLILRIFELPYKKDTSGMLCPRRDLALDCFRLSFALMGMNSADLFSAETYIKGRIKYYREKTKDRRSDRALMEVDVHPCIRSIVEKYRDNKEGRHVFCFHRRYADRSAFNAAINKGLKEVGREIGIEGLQFYAARHSMATIACNDVGIPIYIVNDMLCHIDEKMRVTNLYIKKDFSRVNEANFRLLDWMFGRE